ICYCASRHQREAQRRCRIADPGSKPEVVETISPAEAIARRIEDLAGSIAGLGLDRLRVVAVLKGSFVFAADLIRALHRAGLSPEIDFISLSSYRDAAKSTGRVDIV